MLTQEQNELLTRVGPGAPMGELMRRYWIPAILAWEIPEADCPPVTIKLLGEELVAFRDTSGKAGIVGARCAHRRAHLFWGRNEEGGLRCVYHGWKFNCEGACVDMPSEPAESNFKDKVKIPAYPTYEVGGMVFCYMGPAEKKPAPPLFTWTQVAPEKRSMSKVWQQCNWLQALEGGIDNVHSNFLHGGRPPGIRYNDNDPRGRATNFSKSIHVEVVPTDYGYMYGSVRDMGDGVNNFARGYQWIMPWNQVRGYVRGENVSNDGHMWVPMDDENTMVFNWSVTLAEGEAPAGGRQGQGQGQGRGAMGGGDTDGGGNGFGVTPTYAEGERPIWLRDSHRPQGFGNAFGADVDVENNFHSRRNMDNKYLIDREVQKTQTYTGIEGGNTQDRAIQESMGAIADRTLERLGTTDRAIIHARRSLMQAIKVVQDGGDPPGVAPTFYGLRAYESIVPKATHWFEALQPYLVQGSESHTKA